ncbi:MAG: hypothetical protein IT463_05835 [Planctomycetes bacterium]|nr:hypothetical protein [Planctomycetota bacterium]
MSEEKKGKRSTENTAEKMSYVAEIVKADPKLTLNAAGKQVVGKFGTRLAYGKLREAFVGAGGAVDTRRGQQGKGRGRKAGKAKAARGGSKRSRENTSAKQAMVADLVKGNPDITMNEVGKLVTQKFKTQLAFPRLREAFKAAGGKIGKPGRRRKPGKFVERRFGRRASDQAAARTARTLSAMPRHVVIIHADGLVHTHEFNSRSEASSFAGKQVQQGVATTSIGYYERQALEVNVGV